MGFKFHRAIRRVNRQRLVKVLVLQTMKMLPELRMIFDEAIIRMVQICQRAIHIPDDCLDFPLLKLSQHCSFMEGEKLNAKKLLTVFVFFVILVVVFNRFFL